MPAHFLTSDSPGNIGRWIGLQIITQNINETTATPEALMNNHNPQVILNLSKYKP